MPCGVFRWTLVYFGVYTDPSDSDVSQCRLSVSGPDRVQL